MTVVVGNLGKGGPKEKTKRPLILGARSARLGVGSNPGARATR
jgi:hypothetical protein